MWNCYFKNSICFFKELWQLTDPTGRACLWIESWRHGVSGVSSLRSATDCVNRESQLTLLKWRHQYFLCQWLERKCKTQAKLLQEAGLNGNANAGYICCVFYTKSSLSDTVNVLEDSMVPDPIRLTVSAEYPSPWYLSVLFLHDVWLVQICKMLQDWVTLTSLKGSEQNHILLYIF